MGGRGTVWDSTLIKPVVKKPDMYAVVVMNDDYTPMHFVVTVLMTVFNLGIEPATRLMVEVHKKGRAKIGSFTFDVAETKAMMIVETARKSEYPLIAFTEMV